MGWSICSPQNQAETAVYYEIKLKSRKKGIKITFSPQNCSPQNHSTRNRVQTVFHHIIVPKKFFTTKSISISCSPENRIKHTHTKFSWESWSPLKINQKNGFQPEIEEKLSCKIQLKQVYIPRSRPICCSPQSRIRIVSHQRIELKQFFITKWRGNSFLPQILSGNRFSPKFFVETSSQNRDSRFRDSANHPIFRTKSCWNNLSW